MKDRNETIWKVIETENVIKAKEKLRWDWFACELAIWLAINIVLLANLASTFLRHCFYANALTAVIIMFTMLRLFIELCKFIRHCCLNLLPLPTNLLSAAQWQSEKILYCCHYVE